MGCEGLLWVILCYHWLQWITMSTMMGTMSYDGLRWEEPGNDGLASELYIYLE